MPKNSKETEYRLSVALRVYHERKKPKIAPLAREFGVSYQQLRGRVPLRTNFRTVRVEIGSCSVLVEVTIKSGKPIYLNVRR